VSIRTPDMVYLLDIEQPVGVSTHVDVRHGPWRILDLIMMHTVTLHEDRKRFVGGSPEAYKAVVS